MNDKTYKVFFAFSVKEENVQGWLHGLSGAALLYAIQLFTDYDPVKTLVRSIVPKINLQGGSARTTTPAA